MSNVPDAFPEPVDLTGIGTEDLVDALKSRFTRPGFSCLIVRLSDLDSNSYDTIVDFTGGAPAALGLTEFARGRIWDQYRARIDS